MLIDAFATTYYKRSHFNRSSLEDGNDVKMVPPQQEAHLHVHMHATHGHMLMGLVLYHLKLSCLIYSGIGLYIRYDRSSLVSAHSVQPDAIDCLFSLISGCKVAISVTFFSIFNLIFMG
uniref:Uncharacterized protein n=1 Tax=Rhizophora mucronata TaxID=61149 RepID=A0A2P2KDM7_RHIMU